MKRWLIALLLSIIPAIALANWLYLPGPGCMISGPPVNEWVIGDDFSIDDTSPLANWTPIVSGSTPIITGGVFRSTNHYITTYYRNVIDIGSKNQQIEGKVCDGAGTANASGVLVRADTGTTTASRGYSCVVNASNARIDCSSSAGTLYFAFGGAGTWGDGECHSIKIIADSSDNYSVYVDFNDDGTHTPISTTQAGAALTGTYSGIVLWYAVNADDVYVDNFKAKSL